MDKNSSTINITPFTPIDDCKCVHNYQLPIWSITFMLLFFVVIIITIIGISYYLYTLSIKFYDDTVLPAVKEAKQEVKIIRANIEDLVSDLKSNVSTTRKKISNPRTRKRNFQYVLSNNMKKLNEISKQFPKTVR